MIKNGIFLKQKTLVVVFILLLCSNPILKGQNITSVSPLNATINEEVTFTVIGSGLPTGMAFFVANLDNIIELSGGNSGVRYFKGTFEEWSGLKPGVIKDAPNGNVLFEFSVDVNDPPIVTNVVPNESILGESQTFTIYGSNLTNDLAYYLPDFGSGTVDQSSNTNYKTFTSTSQDNAGIKHSLIKDHPGGTVIYNFDVDVYFPMPQNLTAVAQGSSQIDLSWSAVSNTYHYKLYRANSAYGNYTPIHTGTNTSYSDASLNPNTTYYYTVQACQNYNQYSCSGQTDFVSATTGGGSENHVPDAPTFRPLPSGFQFQENVSSTVPIRSGTDQDGDETRVKLWSANSSNNSSNPYYSDYSQTNVNYNAPITFTQSGSQIVYIQSFDIYGAASNIVSRTYEVLPENTNDNPNDPSFINFPDQVDINISNYYTILSGTDPNGDQTKVKVWAANSNHTSTNPYYTNFENGGHQFLVPLTFNQEGTQTVFCQTIDINNNTSNIVSHSISVINGTTSITEVLIGNIEFTAANIVETQTNVFTLTGNVLANDIVHFTGTVILNLNDLSVNGNGRIYLTNIPNFTSDVDLYDGSFVFDVPNNSSELIAVGINETNELLSLANLPIHIDEISLLNDGINISGEAEFPNLFGNVRGSINQLQITHSQGLDLIGSISISQIQATSFKLNNINFSFNTIEDKFSGSGEIETNLFEAGANVEIVSTGINEIGMFLSLTNPKPLGTTGLALSGLSGNISNIQTHPNPPMIITIGASLTPIGVPTDIVEFSEVSLTYQFGTSIAGNGIFTVLGTETANAGFEVSTGVFKVNAEINFYNVINAAIEAGIAKNQNNSIDISARFYASLQLPDGEGFPYSWLRPFVDLPHTFADFDNILFNSELSGKGLIDVFIFDAKFSYLLNYSNGTIHKDFAKNYSLFNESVFTSKKSIQLIYEKPPTEFTDYDSPKYTRFEGRSLIINSSRYKDSKDRSGNITQDFILTSDIETIVVRVEPEDLSFVPEISLMSPSGEIISPTNVNNYDNVEYSIDNDANGVYFTINDAVAGTWIINLVDNGKDQFVDVFGTDNEAGIIINSIQKTGNQVEVSWVDDNPDFNGQISLYYDYDNEGLDGSLIVSGISEDNDPDTYTFDVTDFGPGAYYVYAIMFDENGVPVTSYSSQPFVIQGNISAPANFTYIINNNGDIEFNWDLINDENEYEYILYHQKDGVVNFGSQNINTGMNNNFYLLTNPESNKIHQFMVVARNTNGVLGEASNSLEVDLAVYQTLSLNAGWNLIGLNVEPFNLSVEDVFSSIDDKLIQVKDETKSYDPNLPDFLNTLSQIENGKGYWVKVSQPGQLTERGGRINIANTQIQLYQGWNLISYPSQYSKDVELALSNISQYIIQVKNINQSYDPNLPDYLNTLDELIPGQGYWIKVNQNCILTF